MSLLAVDDTTRIFSTLMTHGLQGAGRTPGYRLFMPFAGGATFVLLQAFGWFFYASMLALYSSSLPRGGGSFFADSKIFPFSKIKL